MDFTFDKIGKITERLKELIVRSKLELDGFRYQECGYKKGNELPAVEESWKVLQKGERWGWEPDSHMWLYKKIDLPEAFRGKDVVFRIVTGREGQWDACNPQFIAYVDGVLTQGMDVNHTTLRLSGKDSYEIYLYAYSGMEPGPVEFIPSLELVDQACETLYYHLQVPLDVTAFLDPISKEHADILHYLNQAVNLLDLRVPYSAEYEKSLQDAITYMETEFYGGYCEEQKVTTICIGHTHIDVAWMWTLAQTCEKSQRSFATVVNLMKQYPEYKFMSSQAPLYKYVKEEAPELYEEIKQLVREGRWEVEGAMWLEADCNLTSGESLVRQLLFGKRFFKQEFDVDSRILWLPDVFGYSAALPQILQKCGVDKFVTSKISWNETNRMPYDTFSWQGIDGTEIFSYFLTAQNKERGKDIETGTTYVGNITPRQVAGTWDRYQQKELNNEAILTFGYGDGGGGPTAEMLEVSRRLEKGIQGCPQTKIDTAANFLARLEEKAKNDPKLPKWVGELYLELHRGTYTSIAKNKRNNRKSEFLYQTAELLSDIDKTLTGAAYPQKELNAGWETILLNQFHDIIPGSSIKEVYEDSDRQYAQIMELAETVIDKALADLAKQVNTEGGVLVFNPQSFPNSGVVEADGTLIYAQDIPAKGYKVVAPSQDTQKVCVGDRTLENQFYRIVFDENYHIISLYDKKNSREVIKTGERANVLQAFEDFPRSWDAWEISNYYQEKMWELDDVSQIDTVEEGVRAGFCVTRRFLDSTITQRILVYGDSPRIDFDTHIDWKQEHILLKAAFPVDINADKATYEIQFGTVERPTHYNTSWDAAKFEVCAHKFADLSEYGYGVSLMNDCKYGHDIHDGVMRLSLLKSATYPNPDADKGVHDFTYSLYPHGGDFKQAGTVQLAYDLNNPMRAVKVEKQEGILPEEYSFVSVDRENVIVDTVKQAEDSGDTVIRLYDSYNMRTEAELTFGFEAKAAFLCDMLENELQELEVRENRVRIPVKPFEIVTLKIKH